MTRRLQRMSVADVRSLLHTVPAQEVYEAPLQAADAPDGCHAVGQRTAQAHTLSALLKRCCVRACARHHRVANAAPVGGAAVIMGLGAA